MYGEWVEVTEGIKVWVSCSPDDSKDSKRQRALRKLERYCHDICSKNTALTRGSNNKN